MPRFCDSERQGRISDESDVDVDSVGPPVSKASNCGGR